MRKTIALAVALASAQPLQAQVIEEIIVTAQKRAENVMDVPIAISAFSGDTLKNLGTKSLSDIGRFTAGVDTVNNDKTLQPAYNIRGIETNDWTIGSDPAVAIYVDNVYAARGSGAEAAFVDVDRIEVLKGPQGTLFGRNATGGAIHIITHKPSREADARIKVTAGNYARTDIEGMLNMPLGESFALRVSGALQKRDGYLENLHGTNANNEDRKNLRAALLWDATEDTEVLARYGYENLDQMSAVLHTLNSAAWEAANPGYTYDKFGKGAWDMPRQQERRLMHSASLEVNHQIDDMTLTSISAWRKVDTKMFEDLDGSNNPEFYFGATNPEKSEFFSQEFRLTGATDRLKWTTGAVYTHEKLKHETTAEFLVTTFETFALPQVIQQIGQQLGAPLSLTPEQIPGFRAAARAGVNPIWNAVNPACAVISCDGLAASLFISQLTGGAIPPLVILGALQPRIQAGYGAPWIESVKSSGKYESWAAYGDATYSLSDDTDLTMGLRYTYDDKQFDLYTAYQNFLLPGLPFGLAFFNGGQPLLDTSESDNWGSLSGRVVLDHHFTDEVMAYASIATGFKSGGFNSLNFGPNIETSYDAEEVINYEIGVKGTAFGGTLQYASALFFYQYDNAQTLELIGKPIPSYNLRNADAEGTGFETEVVWAPSANWLFSGNYAYLDTEYTKYDINYAAGETAADDLEGKPRAQSPKNKYNLSGQYTYPIPSSGRLVARVDYTWMDDRIDVTRGEVSSFGLTNARLSFFSADEHWEVALWGTNLADKEVLTVFGNGEAVNSTPAWRIAPRMYGLDVGYSF